MSENLRNKVPNRVKHAEITQDNDVYSIHEQQEGNIFLTNAVGAEVWNLCDGANTVAAIIDTVNSKYASTSEEMIERDVISFLERCGQKHVLTWI